MREHMVSLLIGVACLGWALAVFWWIAWMLERSERRREAHMARKWRQSYFDQSDMIDDNIDLLARSK